MVAAGLMSSNTTGPLYMKYYDENSVKHHMLFIRSFTLQHTVCYTALHSNNASTKILRAVVVYSHKLCQKGRKKDFMLY